jgi:hypothetical protein
MLELQKSVGFIHVVLSFIFSIYFLWAPARFDLYYLVYFLLLSISWSIMKNECAISYLFKYIGDPNYQMGDSEEVSDYNVVLGPTAGSAFLNYVLFMYVFNLVFINYSTNRSFDSTANVKLSIYNSDGLNLTTESFTVKPFSFTAFDVNALKLKTKEKL